MTPIEFVLLSLAVWRLASLLAEESGPNDILDKFRYRIGVRYDERSEPYGKNVIARGAICVWCNSIWIGILFALAYFFFRTATLFISLPFALSAGAIVIKHYLDH